MRIEWTMNTSAAPGKSGEALLCMTESRVCEDAYPYRCSCTRAVLWGMLAMLPADLERLLLAWRQGSSNLLQHRL